MSEQQGQTLDTQNADAEPVEQGSLDAAAQAFQKRETTEPQQEAEPDPEPAEDLEAEAAEADPTEEPEAEELVEVEIVPGEKVQLSAAAAEQLQKDRLRQSDYSRLMNEVSTKDKTLAQKLENAEIIEKTAEQRAEALATIKSLDEQIAAYEGIDWAKAEAENPGGAALAAVKLLGLQQKRDAARSKTEEATRAYQEARQRDLETQRGEMHKVLTKELKGWGDELGRNISAYAIQKLGYTEADLHRVTDPKWVIAMDKARRFDALQEGKTAIKAKAQAAPPVLKPGAARPPSNARDEAMARLRKSGTQDDAAAAFRTLMKS